MGKKKKQKSKKKQFWGLPKDERLELARSWVKEYEGKNIVKAYSKKFGLNLKNSMKDLKKIGYKISNEEKIEIKRILKERKQRKENKKLEKQRKARELEDLIESDETYAFIAGYTEGGVPFGVTWEEIEKEEKTEIDEVHEPLNQQKSDLK